MKHYYITLVLILSFCNINSGYGDEFSDTLKAAEQGDADAHFFVGLMYDEGDAFSKISKKQLSGIVWPLTKAIKMHNII